MTIGLSDAAFTPDPPNFIIFFLLKCGTPDQWMRAWSGRGDFPLAADAFDTTGGTYMGLPMPQGLPELSQAINGSFQGLEFSLSGVNAEIMTLAGADRDLVNGAKVHVGVMDLDEHQQPIGSADWLFRAIAAKPTVKRSGQGDLATRTISLPVSTAFKNRHLSPVAYLTPQGQRARSADDAFCDLTPAYSAASTVKWPG